ncbi:MAG TPA: hypothetical protein VHI52_20040 [Verrucomicrobiae bacterium]|nr:hypothetical protein [Verrucomicrobiae bacterium]
MRGGSRVNPGAHIPGTASTNGDGGPRTSVVTSVLPGIPPGEPIAISFAQLRAMHYPSAVVSTPGSPAFGEKFIA